MMKKLYQLDVELIKNHLISPCYKILAFDCYKISRLAQPGQFITIDCGLLLRRPFSIYNVENTKVYILYKIVGKGTQWLSDKKPGEKINVFGPLGDVFFSYPLSHTSYSLFFVAGGTGIASLNFLAQKINHSGILFYGVKTKSHLVGLDAFKQKHWKIRISTEDGSFGVKGLITGLFIQHLLNYQSTKQSPVVYACGPRAMLKEVATLCNKKNIKCYISLEDIIACGMGTCRGCVIKTTNGYETICKDGPVFDAQKIIW